MSIKVENLSHVYAEGTPNETVALDCVSFEISDNEFVGIIGHTGSSKSTLIQHINGLLKPKSGRIVINDIDIFDKGVVINDIRRKIGLVFQFPEYQLFADTVYHDIAFGPQNLGLSEAETENRVKEAISLVALDYEEIKDRSPFELSGGQKRKVAIAGVIAMKPEILILDEPTAGLDPKAHKEILQMLKQVHVAEKNITILVSHNMGDVAEFADKIIVMDKGKVALTGSPSEVYQEADLIESIGLGLPPAMVLLRKLKKRGKNVNTSAMTVDDVEKELFQLLRSN
ncbi:Sulfate-transporting ATPase [Syntrophobotulus glycolicus DSM 8271]|uniref:Energy-coupling factor transporter ATP-binding protein EcfA2 n=1 Tax=Syntrophobotulus glycolicus (strain DSM 8271 / FlGlyR) TaxID=645991 RepID=F0SVT0_SYNGF|nr:energy-coupling factor transporter ATPase [Syntrophobotulus glycolicus]ADY55636.1 Sulfate-transporting ATPase [Syntrophobotulus glycolicus DSM 8271]